MWIKVFLKNSLNLMKSSETFILAYMWRYIEKKPRMVLKAANINYEYEIVMVNSDYQRYW